ncbi:uncharacterized protein LOC124925138 [Impatiens glandulifera]|uniref:uncharacterized protein LOC124925138 n=1 Tax=Impatiens glandulifera TaxID=253017 RepID=UPI001FB0F5B9|nr:uncharacterized protein LOC124925138 [Impatiens glandulifera]
MGDTATTTTQKKRDRDDSDEFELASPEVKRLRDDLLSFLDDSDHSTATPDLDLFMRSFQQEISASPVVVVDLTEEPDESRLDLGYLLEASDDELGLPPPPPPPPTTTTTNDIVALGSEMWRFDEQISSYDEFGIVGDGEGSSYSTAGEYVALEGLFDYSDADFCTVVDEPEFLWRQETLPSL